MLECFLYAGLAVILMDVTAFVLYLSKESFLKILLTCSRS